MTGPGALPAAEMLTARTGLCRSQSPAFAALRRGATDVLAPDHGGLPTGL